MTQIQPYTVACNNISAPPREFLVSAVRCARLRVQLLQTEIDEVGVALTHGMITPEVAVEWLYGIDAFRFMFPEIGVAE
jgi:hypothetical protein